MKKIIKNGIEYVINKYGAIFPRGVSNTNDCQLWKIWYSIFQRCYDPKVQSKMPSYIGCGVSKEWFEFDNFKDWYVQQRHDVAWHIDKDILVKGNRIYSPETCCVVPTEINSFYIRGISKRGNYPIGVHYSNKKKGYIARVKIDGYKKTLGQRKTPEEAFLVYKKAKEEQAKVLAERWKDRVDTKVYNALMNYTVDIDD